MRTKLQEHTILERTSLDSERQPWAVVAKGTSLVELNVNLIKIVAASYNRPELCANATWNTTGVRFANASVIGTTPHGMFINRNNTVYVPHLAGRRIVVWPEGGAVVTSIVSGNSTFSYGIFELDDGELYANRENRTDRIARLRSNGTIVSSLMSACSACYDIFIDQINNLYCAAAEEHRIVSIALNGPLHVRKIVAGTGLPGSSSTMLRDPMGVFVDRNLTIYVADCNNDRIQRFWPDEQNGTTVVGNGSSVTIVLKCPTGVILDDNGYMFIVNRDNNRVIGSGPFGFRCLFGCGGTGSASNQLSGPTTVRFDRYGNIFVVDKGNSRIQKFTLISNNCSKCYFITPIM